MTDVLFLTDELRFGGAETYYCLISNQLSKQGIQFHLMHQKGAMSKQLHPDHQITHLTKSHVRNLQLIRGVIQDEQITIVHANSLRMLLYCLVVQRSIRRKLVVLYTKHNITLLEKYAPRIYTYVLNHHVFTTIALSLSEQERLLHQGISASKLAVVYNGVDLEQFSVKQKRVNASTYRIGMLARLSKEKNPLFFLEVMEAFKEDDSFHFYMGGDGPERARVEDEIVARGLEDNVTLMGHIERPKEFLEEMDVLVLPSHREVLPMVLLESLAVGTNVVVIDRGGIREVISDEQVGFIIKEHDKEAFAQCIRTLCSDRDLRHSMSKRGRQRVEQNFSIEKMLESTYGQYAKSKTSSGGLD